MRSVKIALAASTLGIAVVIVVVLSHAPAVVAGTNGAAAHGRLELRGGDVSGCQQVGTVPQGTTALRVSIGAGAGPRVRLRVFSEGHLATQGELPAGWGLAAAAVVPVKRLSHELRNATVCTTLGRDVGPLGAMGRQRPDPTGVSSLSDVELRMEYLQPGTRSWWSLAGSVADRMGLGRAKSGPWIVGLALLLMFAVAGLAARLALDDLR